MRFYWRLLRLGLHLVSGVLQMALLFRWLGNRQKQARIKRWSQQLLKILGVRLSVHGLPPQTGGMLLAANHISWLDIFLINSVVPQRFVAKSEVRSWPVIGYLAEQAGTMFVRREHGGKTAEKVKEVETALRWHDSVTLFPEGTTSSGCGILPFKSSFFQAALEVKTPVLPLLCCYPDAAGQADESMAYYNDVSLWQSIKVLLGRAENTAVLHFLPPVAARGTRRELADSVRLRLLEKMAWQYGVAASPAIITEVNSTPDFEPDRDVYAEIWQQV